MRLALILLIVFSGLLDCRAWALTVQVTGGSGTSPPTILHESANPAALQFAIQLHNESPSMSQSIAFWQLALSIEPASAAMGLVEIQNVGKPAQPFFDSPFGPTIQPPTLLPSQQAIVSDFHAPPPPLLPGKEILAGETRDLVALALSHSPDAHGKFYLVLGGFDPVQGSAWSTVVPPQQAFVNQPGAILSGKVVLAELVFTVPEPQAAVAAFWGMLSLAVFRLRRNS